MTAGTGIFTVAEAGIYQLTFTAKYVASNRGRFGAWSDMYVNQKVSSQSYMYQVLKNIGAYALAQIISFDPKKFKLKS